MLNKEELLRKTNRGLDIFRHYILIPFNIGRNFLNPLYEDKKASCNVFFDRNSNCYRLKDFGDDDYSGDCFFFVGILKGLDCNDSEDFKEILNIINDDMFLELSESKRGIINNKVQKQKNITTCERETKPFSFKEQMFSENELSFWKQYGITQDVLNTYKVCSIKEFQSENSENKPYTLTSTLVEPIFGYKGKRYIKLYRPFSQIRFLYGGDIGNNYCFGLEQLPAKGDTIFITGGEKDVISLASHGFHAICFNSETVQIPHEIIHNLTFRFKHIILLYDVDKTGKDAAVKQEKLLCDYGVKRLLLPLSGSKEEKDISDYFKLGYTRGNFMKLFLDFLDNLYNDTLAMLKSCEVDFENPPVKSQEIISAGDVPLGTQGNILCITGGEGTGKSNYVAALIAGTIRKPNTIIDTLGINVNINTKQKAVLLYDTEQSEVQLFKNVSNLLQRAKLSDKPKELKAFCLTGMSRKERLQSIVQSMDKFYYEFGGIQLVVIDGIADLVHSANDEAESLRVVDELYRLAGIYKTCMICVLHYVPNGLKLRGHLGSELQRKSSAILSIELENDQITSVVKALKVREGSPLDVPLMQFSWDKEVGMHLYRGEKPREEKEKRKEKELVGVALEIFEQQKFITYIDLCEKIQQIMDVKERTAKSYIRFMREKDIIIKDPSNQTYFIKGHI
ncbi:toprim domain-containing protein [Bacteroidales bacterium OttesenSCG-928-K22]|nr:toprim domain-containing protein [Bacteroidales bacterium OttesenSCG-928-L14]MDL2240196.1 toprim domain-containing protein [Bacteroidales bacterium OttesenSCG-928-K22]